MTQVDMSVFHAHHIKLLQTITKDVFQDNAQESMRFLEMLQLAMHAENAKRDPHQTTWEEDVLDTLLHPVLAIKDSINQDLVVLTAQLVLDHHLITEAASASTATQTRSWEEIFSAHNANGAHQDLSQIQRERTVSSSQGQPLTLMVSQLVTNSPYSTWIELSA